MNGRRVLYLGSGAVIAFVLTGVTVSGFGVAPGLWAIGFLMGVATGIMLTAVAVGVERDRAARRRSEHGPPPPPTPGSEDFGMPSRRR